MKKRRTRKILKPKPKYSKKTSSLGKIKKAEINPKKNLKEKPYFEVSLDPDLDFGKESSMFDINEKGQKDDKLGETLIEDNSIKEHTSDDKLAT